ncbi:hypothetical protein F5Y03DRAFT_292647 [Xylaria venustula]|nr:hypothetical protein F5Y03DRAFT_292647 [Xylaria venustula]
MAATNRNQTEEKKPASKRGRKAPNPKQKRGQPTAAARLISSPYIKLGWHTTLGGGVKEAIQEIHPLADAMYMLQISRTRPIEPLSLRNAIFWEHRQLARQNVVTTPAVDHLDLFPTDESDFQATLKRLGKQICEKEQQYRLHYLFSGIRSREFLLLPVEIDGVWVTIIARVQSVEVVVSEADREITDLAIVDPLPEGREARQALINSRLSPILHQGCIKIAGVVRQLSVPDIDIKESQGDHRWKTGLIAYAISREFLRRLSVLEYRRIPGTYYDYDQEFLWAPFEEHYNLDAYRQRMMAACAHQAIEGSQYQSRLALEVPSENSNYNRELLRPGSSKENYLQSDEKWDVFTKETHTCVINMRTGFVKSSCPSPQTPASPSTSSTSLGSGPNSPGDSPMAPVAPMGSPLDTILRPGSEISNSPKPTNDRGVIICELYAIDSLDTGVSDDTDERSFERTKRKRSLSDISDDEDQPSPKRRKIDDKC